MEQLPADLCDYIRRHSSADIWEEIKMLFVSVLWAHWKTVNSRYINEFKIIIIVIHVFVFSADKDYF